MLRSSLSFVAVVACTVSAQPQITFTRIADLDTQVLPLGNRPALHNGIVAFSGYTGSFYGDAEVIATTPADGSGGFDILASDGDPLPQRPEDFIEILGNPAIYNGRVIFFGQDQRRSSATYVSDNGAPFEFFYGFAMHNPSAGPLGVTDRAGQGVTYIDLDNTVHSIGRWPDPMPCDNGIFNFAQVRGLRYIPQSDHHFIFPTRVLDVPYEYAIVAYDINTEMLNCVVTSQESIPEFNDVFGFFAQADTDGVHAAFIGYDTQGGFDRNEGVYVRNLDGTGPIRKVADKFTPAPNGNPGVFGSFENVTIDNDLVIFEGCAGGQFSCDRYGFFGCFLDNGVPGEIFEIFTTAEMLGGRSVIDLTINPSGRDGNQFAFDARHAANEASLYVATVLPADPGCPPDLNGDGEVNTQDFLIFLNLWAQGDADADWNGDGAVNSLDFLAFLNEWVAGC